MAKILNHPRVYAFLHVPVQSASDSVLMDMKREYCVDDFKKVVDFLKERWDGTCFSSDQLPLAYAAITVVKQHSTQETHYLSLLENILILRNIHMTFATAQKKKAQTSSFVAQMMYL